MASPFRGSAASSPFHRHAIVYHSDPNTDQSAVAAADAASRSSPTPDFIGSVSLGAWRTGTALHHSVSGGVPPVNWSPPPIAAADFNECSPSPAVAATELHGDPRRLESMYMMRASQTKLFAPGKGGVGLIFADENSQLVVRGIVPGGTPH